VTASVLPWNQLTAAQAKERAEVAQARATARWAMVSTMPSTNVRIAVTIGLVVGTFALMATSVVIRVVQGKEGQTWEPSALWLGFLVALGGLDLAQFGTKRTTNSTYVAAKAGEPPKEPLPKPPEVGA
jgi:hypothetical protein